MEIFFAYLIPIIGIIVLLLFFRHRLVWWELTLPIIICSIFIFGFKACVETAITTDIEYRGSIITHAQYYEPYETWVHRTCTRSYKCGKSTCTTTYDCSYCDEYRAKYFVYDDLGNEYPITSQYYYQLKKRWKSNEEFHELNRNINYHFGCGKDGDMYRIYWDQNPITSDAPVNKFTYENRVQASHSVFSYPYIDKDEAKKLGLYKYPEFYGEFDHQQNCILGLDSIKSYTTGNKIWIHKKFEYFNGIHGPKNHIKLFVLLFFDKPIDIAFKQEAFWDGGNDNEMIICIGVDKKTKKINWVKPFSWTHNKRVLVEVRDRIANHLFLSPENILESVESSLIYWKRKDFKEFSYLTVDIPPYQTITTYIVTFIITLGCCLFAIYNEIH